MNKPPAQWCCNGYNSECPLCPEYGTSLLDPCPGHVATEDTRSTVDTARLHAERRHPDYEYATTTGPRKQWDDSDVPPYGDDGEPDTSWESNVDAGQPGTGWERFDYTEESYWRRRKQSTPVPAAFTVACAALHTDGQGNVVPCPGYPHADMAEPEPDNRDEDTRPEAPSAEESNPALPVEPDPRQPAYDAVYEYIRQLGGYLPPDPVHRNAIIWRAVQAALGATTVGRCVSSHCVDGDHMVFIPEVTP
ncbi:hypothetical protein [Streptomyces sp. NPDC048200]|uniref:hypothetical protein n=1 Tax=Streptomyces sp. NPDC048200 TaxID=3365512 RepID=UPI003721DA4A